MTSFLRGAPSPDKNPGSAPVLRKLASDGIDHSALKWFDSYLSDRQQKCVVNGELSGARAVTCGVPQGSLIDPLLFLTYIIDLPSCLSKALPRMYVDEYKYQQRRR